ncbi:MAG: hypothetical protein HQK89_17355 [Nitrospirae bacterium]|nr:hypothetical protein [Nitrospirota bacterium]
MDIQDSAIKMSSSYTYTEKKQKTGILTLSSGSSGNLQNKQIVPQKTASSQAVLPQMNLVDISHESKVLLQLSENSGNQDVLSGADLKTLLVQALIEKLTGKKISIKDLMALQSQDKAALQQTPADVQPPATAPPAGNQQMPNQQMPVVNVVSVESTSEQENMTYNADGVIKTADGRNISFTVQLQMQRSSLKENQTETSTSPPKQQDPLVVNFGGNAAQLSNMVYGFDLNSNGGQENIHMPGPGSGFLSLDLNGDGKINNGSELFGPGTGNGFSELAKYDDNQDGWIDEKDPVYNRLAVWTKNAGGGDSLTGLKDLGIGAISLQDMQTTFNYKDVKNTTEGTLRSTGVFIKDNGEVGTVQQVDLTT